DLSALYLLLKQEVGRKFAAASVMLCSAWFCLNANHNLLIAYACCHQLPIGLLFLSMLFFGRRIRSGKKRHTVLSCLFLLLSCMIYEAFAASLLIFAVWALTVTETDGGYFAFLRKAAVKMLPQTGTAFAYCMVYFGWQLIYPPSYSGTALVLSEPFVSLAVLSRYSTSLLPSSELMRLGTAEQLTVFRFCGHLLHPAAWLCAVLTAASVFLLLPRLRTDAKTLRRTLLLSGIGIPVPCLLVSFTEKYIEWYRCGTTGYLPSFYSYFFAVVFLTAAGTALYQTAGGRFQKHTVRIVLTVLACGMTLAANSLNDMWKPFFENQLKHYRSFDQTVSGAPFTECSSSWQVYAPDYRSINNYPLYTEDYLKIYNPADIPFVNEEDEIRPDRRILCIRAQKDDSCTVTGEINTGFLADTVTVRTLQTGTLTVQLYDSTGAVQTFEHVRDGDVLRAPDGTAFDLRNSFPQPENRDSDHAE
ncbi:MAG: hypothetical protein J5722_10155, partial [Oscillospiraceae bacterium]|nr:hypothetical protein [Oscillospiraceae bacterium]